MGASSFPDSRILRTPPALDWGRPRLALPITPPDAAASCPAPPRLRVCRRWSFESPRIPHPISAPGGFQASSFPAALFRPLRLSMHPWSRPQFLHLPALPAIRPSSRPEVRTLQHRLTLPLRVCPAAWHSKRRLPMHSAVARFMHPPAVPATELRVAPNLSSFGASVACAHGRP